MLLLDGLFLAVPALTYVVGGRKYITLSKEMIAEPEDPPVGSVSDQYTIVYENDFYYIYRPGHPISKWHILDCDDHACTLMGGWGTRLLGRRACRKMMVSDRKSKRSNVEYLTDPGGRGVECR